MADIALFVKKREKPYAIMRALLALDGRLFALLSARYIQKRLFSAVMLNDGPFFGGIVAVNQVAACHIARMSRHGDNSGFFVPAGIFPSDFHR